MRASIDAVPPDRRESATNLVHYVALRQLDLRELQAELQQHGLSSLGRSESCVLGNLLEVTARVHESLAGSGDEEAHAELALLEQRRRAALSWETAMSLLRLHTREVLGPRPADRHIYIMVTAPSASEADAEWMRRMLLAGMNVLRINSSHESAAEWRAVTDALRQARGETGRECRVVLDLAGPKIRTGPMVGARRIATWKCEKDDFGQITMPARVVVERRSAGDSASRGATLALDDETFGFAERGDELRFRDARHRKRRLVVLEVGDRELVTEATRRAYVPEGTRARLVRAGKRVTSGTLSPIGAATASIDVRAGDLLVLTLRSVLGRPPVRRPDGSPETPGLVACTLPEALAELKPGHRVLFDDGRIGALVDRVTDEGDFLLRVVRVPKQSVKLRPEKGINLPDTSIDVAFLTPEDREALGFAAEHADAIASSFVRGPADVRALHRELEHVGRTHLATILKIETRLGFENLPSVLLESLRRPPCAVMIARGDLAAEVGFERLAELQDEMLWLCEASHIPSIWATQVLDTLARTGVPSRAEVTDASAGVAAECVMLNKGPFVEEAVRALADILRRMEEHRYKKRSLFRKLRVSTFSPRTD